MITFILANPSRQHAHIFYRFAGRERYDHVTVQMGGEAEVACPDEEKDDLFKQLDLQCRPLGLSIRER